MTEKERKLLWGFLSSAFLLVNVVGLSLLRRQTLVLETQLMEVRAQEADSKRWMAEKNLWMERKGWLDAHQPKLTTSGEATASLLDAVQSGARKQHLTTSEEGFLEMVTRPYYQQIGVRVKARGSLEGIMRWMTDLQQPGRFQAVKSLSLKSDEDPSMIKCELQLVRWYAPLSKS